jgi:hypothetical protein
VFNPVPPLFVGIVPVTEIVGFAPAVTLIFVEPVIDKIPVDIVEKASDPETTCKTWPLDPITLRPVPPDVKGIGFVEVRLLNCAVPEKVGPVLKTTLPVPVVFKETMFLLVSSPRTVEGVRLFKFIILLNTVLVDEKLVVFVPTIISIVPPID